MKIHKLTIENFRQFNGKHSIEFSYDSKKNVTVVHGENGSGKTTLLNSFKWCFYGKTDFDTENRNILNTSAINSAKLGDILTVSITVEFENDSKIYIAQRKQRYKKIDKEVTEERNLKPFSLGYFNKNGEFKEIETPETHIDQIMPQNMHPYFFFNGERIEKLSSVSQSEKIQEAIKILMGLEIVERGSNHLRKVKTLFTNELKANSSPEDAETLAQEQSYEEEINDLKENLKTAKNNKNQYLEEQELLKIRLKELSESKELQQRREELEKLVETYETSILDVAKKRKNLISKEAFISLSDELFLECGNILEKGRKEGNLPYKIKEQFVDDLLKLGKCICGREIKENSLEYKSINEYRKDAGDFALESEFINLSAACKGSSSKAREFKEKLLEFQTNIDELKHKLQTANNGIAEIGHRLKASSNDNLSALQNKYENTVKNIEDCTKEIGVIELRIRENEGELIKTREKKKKIESIGKQNKLIEKRIQLTEKLKHSFDSLLNILSNQVREELSKKVDETFQKIIRKPYKAIIDEEYRLQIYKINQDDSTEHILEKSTGENQVTSLSFISSIIHQARERHKNEKAASFYKGGLFPLVMDSPFGALDDDYREKIAKYIPELAEQVIILVSNSQWEGKVREQCEERIGAAYQLLYFSPSISKDNESHYVRWSADEEYTEIRRVSNG